jgi:hypothetical protein
LWSAAPSLVRRPGVRRPRFCETTRFAIRRPCRKEARSRNRSPWLRAAYLKSGGALETAAAMANHASMRTTQLYDPRRRSVSIDEIDRVPI